VPGEARGSRRLIYVYGTDGRSSAKTVRASNNTSRQIRNAFQTAVAIAKYEAKARNRQRGLSDDNLHIELSDKQFRKVASIAEQFDEYLNDLHGKNEADLAKSDKTWVDGKDVERQKEGRKASRDRDRSESRGRYGRGKRKRNDSLDDSEDSDESDDLEYRSKRGYRRGGQRRSQS